MSRFRFRVLFHAFLLGCALLPALGAQAQENAYLIQPGDVLQISVWGEKELNHEVLVLPDRTLSFPLAGVIAVDAMSVQTLTETLVTKLDAFIPGANVHVALRQVRGSVVYVLGKVNRPGAYPLDKGMSVLQALSLAGGMATFAEENLIKVIREQEGGSVALPFRYGRIALGKELDSNIALQSGDVVLVP
jgi:polysaccharide export outer membrane protein